MHETFTPDSLISHLYHSDKKVTESFLDSIFSDEFLMNEIMKEADKFAAKHSFVNEASQETINSLHQFASAYNVEISQ